MRALLCVVATAAALSGSARPPPRPPRGKSKGRSRAQRRGNGNVPSSVPADESIDAREARLAAKFAAWAKEPPRDDEVVVDKDCLLYTSPSPRDGLLSRMPSSA